MDAAGKYFSEKNRMIYEGEREEVDLLSLAIEGSKYPFANQLSRGEGNEHRADRSTVAGISGGAHPQD